MISAEVTNYQDRNLPTLFPSVPDFRKLTAPPARVAAPVRIRSRSGKNSGLISADEVEISSRLPYTAPRGRATPVVVVKIGDDTARRRERGMAVVWRWPRMCVVCERDNINSRHANTSHRCSWLNINGEVPVIASPRSAFKGLDELIIR